jgi:hypothetical protein
MGGSGCGKRGINTNFSRKLKIKEPAGTPARREQSEASVVRDGNKLAVRVQWRVLVGKTMKLGGSMKQEEIREYFSNYQRPTADSGLRR